MRLIIACVLSMLSLQFILSANIHAVELPGTVQPGQIEQQFQQEPKIRAERGGRIVVPETDQPVPSNAQDIRFKLTRIVIEGATVYSEKDLLSDYQSRLNNEVTLADIYQIASALTAKYRNNGYILSRVVVPAQSIDDGKVTLNVIEGYIAGITIVGADDDHRRLVQSYAEKIRECRPLKNEILERYLLLMNDLPGVFAQAVIKPSQKEPGASEMNVQYSQNRLQGGLSIDNRGGKSLGPTRISADIGLNSVVGLQESTAVRVVTSGDDKLKFLSFSHEERIGSEGGRIGLLHSTVESTPEEMDTFIPLNLETSSQTTVLMYSHPLIRSRSMNMFLRGSFTVHEGETQLFGVQESHDKIRAFRLGATYDLADAWGVNLLDIEVSRGIEGLGSSKNDDPMLSRPEGRLDFTKASLYAARVQYLAPRLSFLTAVNAQYAWTDLLSSELYSFGGEQIGRGYDPSEMVGDHGIGMKFELRYTDTLPGSLPFSYTGYAFYDFGRVYQRSPAGLSSSESAASSGLGLKMSLGKYISCYAEIAKPLTRYVAAEESRNARGYAGLSIRF